MSFDYVTDIEIRESEDGLDREVIIWYNDERNVEIKFDSWRDQWGTWWSMTIDGQEFHFATEDDVPSLPFALVQAIMYTMFETDSVYVSNHAVESLKRFHTELGERIKYIEGLGYPQEGVLREARRGTIGEKETSGGDSSTGE